MELVIVCLEVRERLDLEIIAEQVAILVGQSPAVGQCDGEHIEQKKACLVPYRTGTVSLLCEEYGALRGNSADTS
jgi:hypothetical protein